MFSDTTMHDEQKNNKRPITEIEPEKVHQSNKRGAHGETEHGETETPRAETNEDTVMADSETETESESESNEANEAGAKKAKKANESNNANESNEANGTAGISALSGIPGISGLPALAWMEMSRPSKHENVVRIAAGTKPAYRAYRAYRPFYVSGLGPGQEKEGLAISAHLDAPHAWSAEEIAERRAEVREVLGAMLANVDELTARMRAYSSWKESVSRAEVREKLAYMLGATWQSFMGVDFPGSGHGTIQCFSSYYTLVAA
jgi:hypothetical protein